MHSIAPVVAHLITLAPTLDPDLIPQYRWAITYQVCSFQYICKINLRVHLLQNQNFPLISSSSLTRAKFGIASLNASCTGTMTLITLSSLPLHHSFASSFFFFRNTCSNHGRLSTRRLLPRTTDVHQTYRARKNLPITQPLSTVTMFHSFVPGHHQPVRSYFCFQRK